MNQFLFHLSLTFTLLALQDAAEPLQTAKLARAAREKASVAKKLSDASIASVAAQEEKLTEAKAELEKAKAALTKAEAEAEVASAAAEKDITDLIAKLEASRSLLKAKDDKPAAAPAKPGARTAPNIYGNGKPASELKGEEPQLDPSTLSVTEEQPGEVVEQDAEPEAAKEVKVPTDRARIKVTVHPDAKVTIDGKPTKATGAERVFGTPKLKAGSEHQYTIKATWKEDGAPKTMTKRVYVRPGELSEAVLVRK